MRAPASLLLALLVLLRPGLAHADPALFVARGPAVTVYLLGSIHALKPDTKWEDAAITRAYRDAGECWFELVLPKNPAETVPLLFARGFDPAHPLPPLLSPADRAALHRRVAALDLPGGDAAVDAMRPWMAWMTLMAATMKTNGLDGDSGVDTVLQHRAEVDGKTVVGLETLEQQVAIFADAPQATGLQLLHDILAAPARADDGAAQLVRRWRDGDIEAVGRSMNTVARRLGPSLADALLQGRNRAWADRLAGLAGSGKTVLVTVGAGHLAGPGNLREQLQARHFTIERVP